MLVKVIATVSGLLLTLYMFSLKHFLGLIDDFLYGVRAAPFKPVLATDEGLDPRVKLQFEGPWEHNYIKTNGVNLHYVSMGKKGKNPLMLMLHGFPENCYSYRHQIPFFSSDYFVVSVDQRGYNLSEKPSRRVDYEVSKLYRDMAGLIKGLGYESCVVMCHDWGGAVGWHLTLEMPDLVDRLIVLNSVNPRVSARIFRTDEEQMKRSWYFHFFQLPWFPEAMLERFDFTKLIDEAHFNKFDKDVCAGALAVKGSKTAMINWYRNMFHFPKPANAVGQSSKCDVPTLIVWGEKDVYLGTVLVEPHRRYVSDITIKYLPDGSHWVQQDSPHDVNTTVKEWLESKR